MQAEAGVRVVARSGRHLVGTGAGSRWGLGGVMGSTNTSTARNATLLDATSLAGIDDGEAPVLSVVIACLNAEQTLAQQLDALAAQACPVPWEVLVCDNGSTDRSRELARNYRDRLSVVVVDASARRGPGAARNIGAEMARGRWLAFCDADDIVGTDWLATMCTALGDHRFVAGRFEYGRLNSRRVRRTREPDQVDRLQRSGAGTAMAHAGAGNMGIHTDLFRRIRGFDEAVHCLEDTDLSWRVQRAGAELAFLADLVVHVRLRSSLRDMYRQGVAYGSAHAQLEERYRDTDPASGPVQGQTAGRRTAWFARVTSLLASDTSLGRLVWQAGWHRGYEGCRHLSSTGAGPALPVGQTGSSQPPHSWESPAPAGL